MFDPSVGRWLSIDPIGFKSGDVNLYRYVHNNPTNFTDPDGLQGKPTLAKEFEKMTWLERWADEPTLSHGLLGMVLPKQEQGWYTIGSLGAIWGIQTTYAKGGTEQKLKTSTFEFKAGSVSGKGTIRVVTGLSYGRGYMDPDDWSKDGIQIELTTDFPLDDQWHFIQFGNWSLYDKDGKKYQDPAAVYRMTKKKVFINDRGLREDQRPIAWYRFNETFLDASRESADDATSMFFDVNSLWTIRTNRRLTIFDRPVSRSPNPKVFGKVIFTGVTFLVRDKNVYYVVVWTRTGVSVNEEWQWSYQVTDARPVQKLPDAYNADTWSGGYRKYDEKTNKLSDPYTYRNPLK